MRTFRSVPLFLAATLVVAIGMMAESSCRGDHRQDRGATTHGLDAVRGLGQVDLSILYGSYNLSRTLEWSEVGGGGKVVLRTLERNPQTLKREAWSEEFSTSFVPEGARSFGTADDFIVFGYGSSGAFNLESWHIERSDGAYFCERPFPHTPIGAAIPITFTSVEIEGSFVPAADRTARPVVARRSVYQGKILRVGTYLEPDPEGRFVLMGSPVDKVLVRVDLSPDSLGEASVIYTDEDLSLLSVATRLEAVRHATRGRGFRLWEEGGGASYLWDHDNDGLFDEIEALTESEDEATYPWGSFEKQP